MNCSTRPVGWFTGRGQHRQIDGVVVLGARGQRGGRKQIAVARPPARPTGATASRFCVSVPVLSEHNRSTPPSSSTAGRWLTTAWWRASLRAPTAMVTDSTAGSATGTEAIVTTSANSSVCSTGLPRISDTTTVNVTSATAITIR